MTKIAETPSYKEGVFRDGLPGLMMAGQDLLIERRGKHAGERIQGDDGTPEEDREEHASSL